MTFIKEGCATRSLYRSSGQRAELVPTNNQRDEHQDPVSWRFRQGPSYTPICLVSQSARCQFLVKMSIIYTSWKEMLKISFLSSCAPGHNSGFKGSMIADCLFCNFVGASCLLFSSLKGKRESDSRIYVSLF